MFIASVPASYTAQVAAFALDAKDFIMLAAAVLGLLAVTVMLGLQLLVIIKQVRRLL